ncbi:hypothetical protein V6N13_069839 [Hibiscus sabdariffa]|uniref:Uncharacterized protein n=1 Tax=Hibiscus sabdariffa TaxID=183260 RepID=A0ABR2BIP9_9ROSI
MVASPSQLPLLYILEIVSIGIGIAIGHSRFEWTGSDGKSKLRNRIKSIPPWMTRKLQLLNLGKELDALLEKDVKFDHCGLRNKHPKSFGPLSPV